MKIVDVSITSLGTQVVVEIGRFKPFEKPQRFDPTSPNWPRFKAMARHIYNDLEEKPEGQLVYVDTRWHAGTIHHQFSWMQPCNLDLCNKPG